MKDSFGRNIEYMRISVTDCCNLRCKYCMPDGIETIPMSQILTFEEIYQIVNAAAELGITKIKLTGGEPLVRKDIAKLVKMLHTVPGITEVTLTTNGVLLGKMLDELIESGLDAVNVSLDTLNVTRYEQITGKNELSNVLTAVTEAAKTKLRVKVNVVLLEDTTENELFQILQLAESQNIDVRYIELMPIGEGRRPRGISGEDWFLQVQKSYPLLYEDNRIHGNGPAKYYRIPGFCGSVGFISAMHRKFCDGCNRIRLSSTGQIKPCLCFAGERDLKAILRRYDLMDKEASNQCREVLKNEIHEAILSKPLAHCFEQPEKMTEYQKMVSIGG